MLQRLRQAAAILRPRAVAQLGSRLTRLSSDHDALARLVRQHAKASERQLLALAHDLEQDRASAATQAAAQAAARAALVTRVNEIAGQLGELRKAVADVSLKCDQLSVAAERLATDEDLGPAVARAMDAQRIRAHVAAALDRSPLVLEPFPHVVIDNLLPKVFYSALINTMPPRVLFEDNPVNKQQLKVPPRLAARRRRRSAPGDPPGPSFRAHAPESPEPDNAQARLTPDSASQAWCAPPPLTDCRLAVSDILGLI